MALYRCDQPITVASCVREVGRPARVVGDPNRMILGGAALDQASAGALCFCSADGDEGDAKIRASGGDIVIAPSGLKDAEALAVERTLILVEDPVLYFIDCIRRMFSSGEQAASRGVRAGAFVASDAVLEENVLIEPAAVVDSGVQLGRGTSVHSGVRLYAGTSVGRDVVIQSNTVVGAVGLAYGREGDGRYVAWPHLGCVVIGDGVHIGPNSTVVKGILTDTVIGRGTKIGNQVNVGHNVKIGENCFISSGVTLCGSVVIGNACYMAAGAVVLNKVRIGDGARVGLGSVVTKHVDPGAFVTGVPARVVSEIRKI